MHDSFPDSEINVIVLDEDTGEVLRSVHNVATRIHRQRYAEILSGQTVDLPQYMAFGAGTPDNTETASEFQQLKSEIIRTVAGTRVLTSSESARIGGSFGPGVGVGTAQELGLFTTIQSIVTVNNCDLTTGWESDGTSVGILTSNHIGGSACITTTRDAVTEVEPFRKGDFNITASGLGAQARLQFWYYTSSAGGISTTAQNRVSLVFRDTVQNAQVEFNATNIAPAAGVLSDGWNFYDIPLSSFSPTLDITDENLVLTGFRLRLIKTVSNEIEERLDEVRFWEPSGDLWAYTTLVPPLSKDPQQTLGIYWYLSIRDTAEDQALEGFAYESNQAIATPQRLTASLYAPTGATRATRATVQNTGSNPVRYRVDGGIVATDQGHILAASESVTLGTFNEIQRFSFARSGNASSEISVTYRRPA